ncbi:MAG: 4a-hydroxytetrahydrobiopterin dehydratase, partial [Flavobacteriales bacterium]
NFNNYLEALNFVNKIAYLSEDEGHHPHVHLNFKNVEVIIFTHKINGLHENDFILAAKCDDIWNSINN